MPLAVFGVSRGIALLVRRVRARKGTESAAGSTAPAEEDEKKEDIPCDGEEEAIPPAEESGKKAGEGIPKLARALADAAGCLAGVLVNTGAVLGMMWAIYMSAMLSVNFVIEVVVFPIVTPPIAYAVRKSTGRG